MIHKNENLRRKAVFLDFKEFQKWNTNLAQVKFRVETTKTGAAEIPADARRIKQL